MGTKNRPFRVAFRVLLVAFVLSLLVIAANPRAVRLAIIAKSQTEPADQPPSVQVASMAADPAVPKRDASADEPATVASHAHPHEASDSASEESLWSETAVPSAPTHSVSSRAGRTEIASLNPQQPASAMPVLSPANLQGQRPRGEYFELPSPPQNEEPSVSLSKEAITKFASSSGDDGSAVYSKTPTAADESVRLVREQLEAEIRSLRREVDRLSDAQKVGEQLARLELEQQKLLRMHEELPVDRMTELADLLLVQLQSVRETIPDRAGPACPECATMEGEVASAGNGRISLRITEAQLEDVLRMFSQLSGKSIVVDSPQRTESSEPKTSKRREPPVEADPPGFATSHTSFPEAPLLSPANPPSSQPLSDLLGSRETASAPPRSPLATASRCASCHPNHVPR